MSGVTRQDVDADGFRQSSPIDVETLDDPKLARDGERGSSNPRRLLPGIDHRAIGRSRRTSIRVRTSNHLRLVDRTMIGSVDLHVRYVRDGAGQDLQDVPLFLAKKCHVEAGP